MQFTDEYIKKNYHSFFDKYEIEVNQTAMPKIFSEALERKKDLIDAFSLGEYGRFIVSEYDAGNEHVYSAFRATCDLLMSVCGLAVVREVLGFVPLSAMLDNVLSTGQKFSRAILRFSEEAEVQRVMRNYKPDLCLELPILPLEGRTDLKLIVQNFYSELAKYRKTNTLRIVLSVNPIDMLTASTGKVSSCNKLGGEYESAPLSAARSKHMGIIRVENSCGELQGRCWIAFSKNLDSFLLQKTYGQISQEHVHAVSNWITTIISKRNGWDCDGWTIFTGDTNDINTELFSEQDNCGEFYVDPNSKMVMHKSGTDIPLILVGDSPCLICGAAETRGKLLCAGCAKKAHRCVVCATRYSLEGADKKEYVCSKCIESASKCENCGKPIRKGRRFCDKHKYIDTACFVCGTSMCIDMNSMADGTNYTSICDVLFAHPTCVKNNAMRTCPKCGKQSSDSNWWHCPTCYAKRNMVENVRYTLRGINALRNKARTCTHKLPTTSFSINLPEYALAA